MHSLPPRAPCRFPDTMQISFLLIGRTIKSVGRSYSPTRKRASNRPWQIIQRAIHVGPKEGKEDPFHHELRPESERAKGGSDQRMRPWRRRHVCCVVHSRVTKRRERERERERERVGGRGNIPSRRRSHKFVNAPKGRNMGLPGPAAATAILDCTRPLSEFTLFGLLANYSGCHAQDRPRGVRRS